MAHDNDGRLRNARREWVPMITSLENVALEESWLLDVPASDFAILLDAALLPGHDSYMPPAPREAHCYRRGWLIFKGVTEFHLYRGIENPTPDPDGTQDWGNLYVSDLSDGRLRLESGFGLVVLACEQQAVLALDAP